MYFCVAAGIQFIFSDLSHGILVHRRHFTKGNNFRNFLSTSLEDRALSNEGQLLKKRICSSWSKFFSLRVDHFQKGAKKENARVPSLERVPIYYKIYWVSLIVLF